MKHLVAGTAGHIDHGKTVLVRALTGIQTDRLPEEQRRGISIELGYAWLDLPDGTRVGLVDVPGHERFVRTMVAGATGIDFAILVVAADDSVMPQTREHLAILHLLGVRDGLVAVTKADLVDEELVEVVVEEVRDAVADTFLAAAPIIPCSGTTGAGLDDLRAAIAQVAGRVAERGVGPVARVPIDRSFTMAGYGAVVTGTVVSGSLAVGQDVDILPSGLRARVRGLQCHGTTVESVRSGQRAAVNLSGVKHDELTRGDVVCTRGALVPSHMIDGRVIIDPHTPKSVRHGTSVSFHVGTSEVAARLILLEYPTLEPGEEAWAQLRLVAPVVARRGDRFILRTVGGEATLGGGQIVDAHPLKHRRHRDRAAEAIARVAEGGLHAAIVHELHKAAQPLRLGTLATQLAESPADIQAAEGDAVRIIESGTDPWLYDTDLFEEVAAGAVKALTAHHDAKPLLATGLTIAALSSAISPSGRLSDDVISAMMSQLVTDGRLRRVENTYALVTHNVEYDEKQAAVRDAVLAACLENPFSPPTTTDLQRTLPFPPDALAAVHEALIRSGELIDGDVCGFHPQAVADAWEKLEAHLTRHGQVTMSDFRKLLGTSRRYALGLMAHFDAQRLVVREGDYRRLP